MLIYQYIQLKKINHAYAYEGIDLLKAVFKVNFDLDIEKYIAVNFTSFMDIIDEIDGVVVDVKDKDIKEINKYIDGCYAYYSNKDSVGEKIFERSWNSKIKWISSSCL